MPHTQLFVLTLVIVSSVFIRAAGASDEAFPHIRTHDTRLRNLVNEGARSSPTFRALVDRLDQSDVVVYLRCDGYAASSRMTFVSSAGGYRYVLVRLQRYLSSGHQLAIIAHELQHAVEVADAPAIVDAASLAQEYKKIGYANPSSRVTGIAFDSKAAVRAGHRVLQELLSSAAD